MWFSGHSLPIEGCLMRELRSRHKCIDHMIIEETFSRVRIVNKI